MKFPDALKAHDIEPHRSTRWDLIKKRHNNNGTFKTDAVKRLIEMDFVGEKQRQRLMRTESASELNPAVVMEVRHEMCKRSYKCLPLASVQQKRKDEWCKKHNQFVDERHINNELNKLRQQLERQREHYRRDMKSAPTPHSTDVDNKRLYDSLKKTSKYVEDCYKTPIQAMDDMQILFQEAKENCRFQAVEEEENIGEEILEFIAEIERSESNDGERVRTVCQGVRCVRFERQSSFSSNSSDGLDSVISDLAEEALQELREEEELKLKQQKIEPKTENHDEEQEQDQDVTLKYVVEDEGNADVTLKAQEELEPLTVRRLELPVKKERTKTKLCPSISTESDDDNSTVSNEEQSKIIEQLFQSRAHTNIYLLRKYFIKWIQYTTLEKISRENSNCKATRAQQINTFLDKLRREKARINKQPLPQETEGHETEESAKLNKPPPPQITKKYQNKYNMHLNM